MTPTTFAMTPTTFAMTPTTLVMRPDACFYCGAEPENDERTLGDAFGIRYCGTHKSAAKRDSNAYLHETHHVKVADALLHPVLGPFLALLESPTAILRSNGAWDHGWRLETRPFADHSTLMWTRGVWTIPMFHGEQRRQKRVPLPTLLDDAFLTHNPGIVFPAFPASRTSLQRVLDDGVYAADYAAVRALTELPHEVVETAGINEYVVGQRLARIFVEQVADHGRRCGGM